jgi:hypothetical protein
VGRSGVVRWVDLEMRTALDRMARDSGYAIIPLLGTGADAPETLPLFLRQFHAVGCRIGPPSGGLFRGKNDETESINSILAGFDTCAIHPCHRMVRERSL